MSTKKYDKKNPPIQFHVKMKEREAAEYQAAAQQYQSLNLMAKAWFLTRFKNKPCPLCNAEYGRYHKMNGYSLIKHKFCPECGAQLIKPESLTLDELKIREGKPVYDWHSQKWFVISEVDTIDELMTEIHMTDFSVVEWDETEYVKPKLYDRELTNEYSKD